jgi:hypothetical protein
VSEYLLREQLAVVQRLRTAHPQVHVELEALLAVQLVDVVVVVVEVRWPFIVITESNCP